MRETPAAAASGRRSPRNRRWWTTSARLLYQALRGLTRSFSALLPCTRSQVHLTSAAVNGLPSCHLTPWRRWKVSSVPSSSHDQSVARSGTIDVEAVLLHVLVEQDEVVEHRHHRPLGDDGRLPRGSTCWPGCRSCIA